jgi:pyruvate dehydrogenase E2 component (dihydrolipoamide acetyltransferase)
MSNLIELKVPDIGGHSNVDIIEVFITAGQTVAVDDSLITLETDKATMEVPAEAAGVVKEVKVVWAARFPKATSSPSRSGASAAAPAPAAAGPHLLLPLRLPPLRQLRRLQRLPHRLPAVASTSWCRISAATTVWT